MTQTASDDNDGKHHLPDKFGVVLGWTANSFDERIVLCMQSSRLRPKSDTDVEEFRYMLDKQQAALLGNFLIRMAGETAPAPRRKGWRRWFGQPEHSVIE